MGYKEGKFKQKTSGDYLRITGFWEKPGGILKSGRISKEGFQNIEQFGEKTILLILPNKRKKGNQPDWEMFAVCDYSD